MIGLLSVIGRGLRMLSGLLGRPFREWAEWSTSHPAAAAKQLEAIAVVLDARAGAIAERRGNDVWPVRRDRHLAHGLREHAEQLRMESDLGTVDLELRCRQVLGRA